jgi:glycogen operon protein
VQRFVRLLVAGRLMRDIAVDDFDLTLNQLLGQAKLEWHGVKMDRADWGQDSHSIALTTWSLSGRFAFHIMVNAWWQPLEFELPPSQEIPGGRWHRWLDTSLPSPADIVPIEEAPVVDGGNYRLPPRSLAVLLARTRDHHPQEAS